MPNPHGNPQFGVKYKGKRKGRTPYKKTYSVRMSEECYEELMSIPIEIRQDLVRQAISKVLAERRAIQNSRES